MKFYKSLGAQEEEFSSCRQLVPYEATLTSFYERTRGSPQDLLNTAYLSKLNSDEWRSQDHYRVLGLGHLRMQVTAEQVRLAYRAWVLKWHPDKCGGNDHIFKCMAKAQYTLADPERRRQFDSCDPTFDERIPKDTQLDADNFFAMLDAVFERNARFSTKQPVPALGDSETARAEVEKFYEFWTNFDSWRTFEYLHPATEGDNDLENRDEKRYKEKQARAAQSKAKATDNARISKLVDMAYRNDPRILRFKAEDAQAKAAKKNERERASLDAKRQEEADQARLAQEALEREAAERELKMREKEQKEVERAAYRNEKRTLKQHFADNAYFSQGPAELEEMALLVEKLLAKLSLAAQVKEACEVVVPLNERDAIKAKLSELLESQASPVPVASSTPVSTTSSSAVETEIPWTPEENDLLIRAVKLVPGGVTGRWVKIAEHLEKYKPAHLPTRTVAQVTAQAERIKGAGAPVAVAGPPKTARDPRINANEPTTNYDASVDEEAWSKEEQAKLEKAMKMVPVSDAQRWDKISKLIPTKTKKQIMERVKSIAAALKAKTN